MHTNVIHEGVRLNNIQVGKEVGAVFAELFGGLNRVDRYLMKPSLKKRDDLLHGGVLIRRTGVMEEFYALPNIAVFAKVHGPLTSPILAGKRTVFKGRKNN